MLVPVHRICSHPAVIGYYLVVAQASPRYPHGRTVTLWDPSGKACGLLANTLPPLPVGEKRWRWVEGVTLGGPGVSELLITQLRPAAPTDLQALEGTTPALVELALRLNLLSEPLQAFTYRVLRDPTIGPPFLAIPASQQAHHSQRGGLLRHSLETMVKAMQLLQPRTAYERDLVGVGGLFHDLGKIRLWDARGARTPTGFVLPHEALTLEILAPYLAWLDTQEAQSALALRHLWSPVPRHSGVHNRLAAAVQAADQQSALENCEDQAFADQPQWRTQVRTRFPGPPRRLWRPLLDNPRVPPTGVT